MRCLLSFLLSEDVLWVNNVSTKPPSLLFTIFVVCIIDPVFSLLPLFILPRSPLFLSFSLSSSPCWQAQSTSWYQHSLARGQLALQSAGRGRERMKENEWIMVGGVSERMRGGWEECESEKQKESNFGRKDGTITADWASKKWRQGRQNESVWLILSILKSHDYAKMLERSITVSLRSAQLNMGTLAWALSWWL